MSHWRGRWMVVCHIGVVGGWLCVTLVWMVVCHIGVVGGWLCVTLAW